MSTNFPQRCPFCDAHDVRQVSVSDLELTAFCCRECSKVFYVASLAFKGAPTVAPADAQQPERRPSRQKRTH